MERTDTRREDSKEKGGARSGSRYQHTCQISLHMANATSVGSEALLVGLFFDRLRPKVIGVSGRIIHATQSNSSAFIDSGSETGFFNGYNLFDIHTPTANTQAINWPSACLGASWRPERPKHWGWRQREICTFTLPADVEIQWREMPLGLPGLLFNRIEHPLESVFIEIGVQRPAATSQLVVGAQKRPRRRRKKP